MQLHALEVTISIVATENCSYGNGKLRADVTGGTPPYTYSWSNGSTQQLPTMLSSGNYTVTVTDSQGAQASANIFLPSGPFLDSDLATTMVFQTGAYCGGSTPAGPLFNFNQPAWFMFAGVAPFTFDGEPGISWECNSTLAGYLVSLPNAQAGTNVDVAFLDANGCPGTIAVTVGHQVEWPSLNVVNVQPACGGASNGSFQLAIGPEGHNQEVWMQILDENDNVILGQNWSYTVGNAPTNLTMSNRPPGTYRVMLHIVNNTCSPLFGQCTEELEVVIPEQVDCPCLNTTQFPSAIQMIPANGQTYSMNCVFFGEHTIFGNIQAGSNYEFTVADNGYITVRQGAVGGPVIGQGFSPVTVNATSSAQLYVHYNGDASCASDQACHAMPSQPPAS